MRTFSLGGVAAKVEWLAVFLGGFAAIIALALACGGRVLDAGAALSEHSHLLHA